MTEFSFVIPLFNEEIKISSTIDTLLTVGRKEFDTFEIIVIDDFSSDDSIAVVKEKIIEAPEIIFIENTKNIGFAESYKKGINKSSGKFVQYIPSDNAIGVDCLTKLVKERSEGKAVLQYCTNPFSRPLLKAAISFLYGKVLNFLKSEHIKYYNGLHIFPGTFLRSTKFEDDSFAFQAEIVLKAIDMLEYTQVGIVCTFTDDDSSALNVNNVVKVLKFILKQGR